MDRFSESRYFPGSSEIKSNKVKCILVSPPLPSYSLLQNMEKCISKVYDYFSLRNLKEGNLSHRDNLELLFR